MQIPERYCSEDVLNAITFYAQTLPGKPIALGWSSCTPALLCSLAKEGVAANLGCEKIKALSGIDSAACGKHPWA